MSDSASSYVGGANAKLGAAALGSRTKLEQETQHPVAAGGTLPVERSPPVPPPAQEINALTISGSRSKIVDRARRRRYDAQRARG